MKHPSAPHVLDLAKALRGVLCSEGLDTGELRQTKMPIETPRVNEAIVPATTRGKKYVNAAFARRLERESYVLMDFINTEMKMTATDPRIGELAERLAAVSNDGTQRPGSPDGSLATETRKPGSLK